MALLPWHPLAGVVGGWQRPGGVRGGVLPLLWWELTVRPVLLTRVTRLGEESYRKSDYTCVLGVH